MGATKVAELEQIADLTNRVTDFLTELSHVADSDFCGLGLVICENLAPDLHRDLRPTVRCPENLVLPSRQLRDYLSSVARLSSPLHDGFHFLDAEGRLTQVAQYFVPPLVRSLEPDQQHGVRVHSARCGSVLPGVILTCVLCSNFDLFVFRGGTAVSPSVVEEHTTKK